MGDSLLNGSLILSKMGDWARRMHRRASSISDVVSSCGHASHRRIEKVKFGVPLEDFCGEDVPAPLLVLILKLNKEGPTKKDVFRAPGHEGAMKKLQHALQVGRLINFENYSVYTVASVIKKFLRKVPGGMFGVEGEVELFESVDASVEERLEQARNIIQSLPIVMQKLLCDLLGTFKAIEQNAEAANTGMTAEAIGVSVAPSFFHSCVADGRTATINDVNRFKVATRLMRFLIEQYTEGNLFKRPIYEHYAYVSGRIITVENQLMCSLKDPMPPKKQSELQAYVALPPKEEDDDAITPAPEPVVDTYNDAYTDSYEDPECWLCRCRRVLCCKCCSCCRDNSSRASSFEDLGIEMVDLSELSPTFQPLLYLQEGKTWLQCECERWGHKNKAEGLSLSRGEESTSMPALSQPGPSGLCNPLDSIPEHSLLDSCTRLSISLEDNVFSDPQPSTSYAHRNQPATPPETLRPLLIHTEIAKSLSCLPQVYERQTARMRARSEWFLQDTTSPARDETDMDIYTTRAGSRCPRMRGGGAACRYFADSESTFSIQPRQVT